MARIIVGIAGAALLVAPLAGQAAEAAPPAVKPATTKAASAPATDQDFLEYLGSWDGSDEDWVIAGVGSKLKSSGKKPAANSPASAPAAGHESVKPDASQSADPAATGQEQDK